MTAIHVTLFSHKLKIVIWGELISLVIGDWIEVALRKDQYMSVFIGFKELK